MRKVSLVASLEASTSSPCEVVVNSLPNDVGWIEVRHQSLDQIDAARLRAASGRRMIYAQQSGNEFTRKQNLIRAAQQFDLVELDFQRDLVPELLARIPVERRIISWQGPADGIERLDQRLQLARGVGASYYKFVIAADTSGDEIQALAFLKRQAATDVIAYANGPEGLWTRVLSVYLGAPMIFGNASTADPVRGTPTIDRLISDYGLPERRAITTINGIVGAPVFHSRSPGMHNSAYRDAGLSALYLPFQVNDFETFWRRVVRAGAIEALGFQLGGFTVTSPNKRIALHAANRMAAISRAAASTNMLVPHTSGWKADTTDPVGISENFLRRGLSVVGKRVAVIGCGGSGRAIAAALHRNGAQVTLVNRGHNRRRRAAKLLSLPSVSLKNFLPTRFQILINATPVGRRGDHMPFETAILDSDTVVVDLPYGSEPTPLSRASRANGLITIDGFDILHAQVRKQREMFMDRLTAMPLAAASEWHANITPATPLSATRVANS